MQQLRNQQITSTLAYAVEVCEEVRSREAIMARQMVSFMNTLDVMIVVMVLANFQIQIVLDL